mmetsp:Transcript_55067/g.141793  ORF Transcript_55067/g.141793 Transcript_55067/m.141793 type:complete len:147 (-) Transcript_55067:163-603(-)
MYTMAGGALAGVLGRAGGEVVTAGTLLQAVAADPNAQASMLGIAAAMAAVVGARAVQARWAPPADDGESDGGASDGASKAVAELRGELLSCALARTQGVARRGFASSAAAARLLDLGLAPMTSAEGGVSDEEEGLLLPHTRSGPLA